MFLKWLFNPNNKESDSEDLFINSLRHGIEKLKNTRKRDYDKAFKRGVPTIKAIFGKKEEEDMFMFKRYGIGYLGTGR